MSRLSIILTLVLAATVLLCFGCGENGKESQNLQESSSTETPKSLEFHDTGRFGALIGPVGDPILENLKEVGIGWVRPHPGPFIWNSMQRGSRDEVDFTRTDSVVREAQSYGFNLLVTLWPFAEWDQLSRSDAANYMVSANDVFARELPLYRGNPVDWNAYDKWLSSVVERYDGDGVDDMEGLKFPVRYWEVLNEPDIGPAPGSDLTFYKGGAEGYAELLQESYDSIKAADIDAQVLIAGAAGSHPEFLGFWRRFLSIPGIGDSFDISNVHCISSGNTEDFNVSPYKNELENAGISKPIWVTEAENIQGSEREANAQRLDASVAGAFQSGAQKIFFTNAPLSSNKEPHPKSALTVDKDVYRSIVEKYDSRAE